MTDKITYTYVDALRNNTWQSEPEGAWQFRWGFPMRLSQRIQFGLDECRRALARAGRWLPPLVLASDGRLKNSIIPH